MQQLERPLVSRVRENRTHGSEGGLPVTSLAKEARVK